MNKKLFVMLFLVLVASICIVISLFLLSGQLKDQRGSFLREFPPHPVIEGDSVNINFNSYYFAGGTSHTVYLGNLTSARHLLQVNLRNMDTVHLQINYLGLTERLAFRHIKIKIDSPVIILSDGTKPVIIKGDLHSTNTKVLPIDSIYFRDLVPISEHCFAIKSLGGARGENILGKVSTTFPAVFDTTILEKQQDGVFCTDGIFKYSPSVQRLIYLYYYRNQFMVMDTSLHLLYRGNTIDTISRARIKTATLGERKTKTLSSPPYYVNRSADVSGELLFVNSNLLAHNEHRGAFKKASVIDVYNLRDGKYKFSFYVYHFRGKTMSEFRVFGDKMIVRFNNVLRLYQLNENYF